MWQSVHLWCTCTLHSARSFKVLRLNVLLGWSTTMAPWAFFAAWFYSGFQVWLFCGFFQLPWIFFVFEKRPNRIWLFLAYIGQLGFICRFGTVFKDDFGRFLGTASGTAAGRFLDTLVFLDTEWLAFIGNSAREFRIVCFVVSCF